MQDCTPACRGTLCRSAVCWGAPPRLGEPCAGEYPRVQMSPVQGSPPPAFRRALCRGASPRLGEPRAGEPPPPASRGTLCRSALGVGKERGAQL